MKQSEKDKLEQIYYHMEAEYAGSSPEKKVKLIKTQLLILKIIKIWK